MALIALRCFGETSSVNNAILASVILAEFNRAKAFSIPDSGLLPTSGMILGFKAGNKLMMVSVSSEIGTTVCALPEKTTRPCSPSCLSCIASLIFLFAAVRREGF